MTTKEILERAKKAKASFAGITEENKNRAILNMAKALVENTDKIIEANKKDIELSRGKVSEVMTDRLLLTPERIRAMADGMVSVASLPDPTGKILSENIRENGLKITKISVPVGVIAIIYESRPNVTSDAAVLALKSGNVCILRGGKEAFNSAYAIVCALKEGLRESGICEDAVNLIEDTSRQSATELMEAEGYIDLLIPRGGAGLIRACVENAKVPCIQTGTGICHIYADKSADIEKAVKIIENAKTSRPSVCNAAEVLIVHKEIAEKLLPRVKKCLTEDRKAKGLVPVELRTDEAAYEIIGGTPAGENDFDTEFLDYILAVKVVDGVSSAAAHITAHSTGHSEAIIAEDESAVNTFITSVDSAALYINASTRFTDGGEFGLGCEMGISTQKLHARGPMGLSELTSYKYIIRGNGHIR